MNIAAKISSILLSGILLFSCASVDTAAQSGESTPGAVVPEPAAAGEGGVENVSWGYLSHPEPTVPDQLLPAPEIEFPLIKVPAMAYTSEAGLENPMEDGAGTYSPEAVQPVIVLTVVPDLYTNFPGRQDSEEKNGEVDRASSAELAAASETPVMINSGMDTSYRQGSAGETAAIAYSESAHPVEPSEKNSSNGSDSGTEIPAVPGVYQNYDEELIAREDDQLTITLDGMGWLYMGPLTDGVSLLSKRISNGNTLFNFQANQLGEYRLDFFRQNLINGTSEGKQMSLEVLDDSSFYAALGAYPESYSETESDPAAVLENSEEWEKDIAELQQMLDDYYSDSGSSESVTGEEIPAEEELYLSIADIAQENDALDISLEYWQKAIDNTGSSRALIALWDYSLEQQDPESLNSLILAYPDAVDILSIGNLEQGNQLLSGDIWDGAVEIKEYILNNWPNRPGLDKLLYELAALYEQSPRFRDLQKAAGYYQRILDDYPLSDYWDGSKDRLNYLQRNYLHIR